MATAVVKFTQNAVVGTAGVAYWGTVALGAVTVENSDNTGVTNWKFEMVDVPEGSAVPLGNVQDGAVATYSFTPDIPGGYLLKITVTDGSGNTVTSLPLCFGVKEASGRFVPPFGAIAASVNFSSQARGWALYVNRYLRVADGGSVLANATTGNQDDIASTDANGESVKAVRFTHASGVRVRGIVGGYLNREIKLIASGGVVVVAHEDGGSTASARITTPTGRDFAIPKNQVGSLTYDSTSSRWRLSLSNVVHEDAKFKITNIFERVDTTTATNTVIASYTMSDETSCTFDFVGGMKGVAGVAKSGRFAGAACYQRNAAGAPTLVGAIVYATPQVTAAGDDMTFNVNGNAIEVVVTTIDGDDRINTIELRVAETKAT
jgi:hypothetical protein